MDRTQLAPALAVVGLLAAAFAPQSFLFGASDWEKVYVPAAARLGTGEDIFQNAFVYPPFAALLAVPSLGLTPQQVRGLFWLMNVIFGSALILGAWNLSRGRFVWLPTRRDGLIAGLGLAASFGFTLDVMVNRQTDLVIGGLMLVGCGLLLRNRDLSAGVAIGLAAGIKCTPLLFVPALGLMGRWRAAFAILAVAVGVNLAVDAIYPKAQAPVRAVEWVQRFLIPVGESEPGKWHAAIGYNHSLAGLINRLTSVDRVFDGDDYTEAPRPNAPPSRVLKVIVYGLGLVLLSVAAGVQWRTGLPFDAAAAGQVLCLMVLLSPMSSKPHFCVLILPAWVVARVAVESRSRWLLGISVLAALLGLGANKDLLGAGPYGWLLWHGSIPLLAGLLFLGCIGVRLQPGWRAGSIGNGPSPL